MSCFLELFLSSKTSSYYINNVLFSTVLLFSFACGNQYSNILPVVNKTTIRKKKKKEFWGWKTYLQYFEENCWCYWRRQWHPLQYSCLEIPWMEEPGSLQFIGLRRVGHDWATSLSLFPFMHWRRKWQPTPVFLPGESQGWGSLVGCRLWGRTESDTTEAT